MTGFDKFSFAYKTIRIWDSQQKEKKDENNDR